MKEPNAISLRWSDNTTVPDYFKYTMRGQEIWITYLGASSIDKDIMRILQQIEYWHQGSITSFRILYQDALGVGGEIKWDGEKAEVIAARSIAPGSSSASICWAIRLWPARSLVRKRIAARDALAKASA